jgi:hypothetical protein
VGQGTTREWAEALEPEQFDPEVGSAVTAAVAPDNLDLAEALVSEAARIVLRTGGVVAITADRVEVAPGQFVTRGLVFKWDSYGGPAQRAPREKRQERPPVEPEPEVVEEPDELDAVAAAAHVPG